MRKLKRDILKIVGFVVVANVAWFILGPSTPHYGADGADGARDNVRITNAGCGVGYVYDGDTVEIKCGDARVRARLLGFDTPETRDAKCPAERAHGDRATARLRDLVAAGTATFSQDGYDRYGRALVRLWIDDVDVANVLINEGLAVAYSGAKRINWCKKLGA